MGEQRASVSAKVLWDEGAGDTCETAALLRDNDVSGFFFPSRPYKSDQNFPLETV